MAGREKHLEPQKVFLKEMPAEIRKHIRNADSDADIHQLPWQNRSCDELCITSFKIKAQSVQYLI